ncbi:MAG: alkaline phosphatase family protein, partial [Polyangiales bacterium]
QALDAALGQLWQAAGGDVVELTVSSDHGSGGSSDKVLYLNRVLADAGLLRLRPRAARLSTAMKALALSGLSPALKEQLFRWQGGVLPGRLESSARFGAIDMAHSVAFSDELNYFPAVHLNLRGREPEGIVSASEACNVKARVQEALLSLRDPWSGQPVVAAVWQREALFEGPAVERAPDLLLELQLDAGYSYNLMPSSTAPAHTGPWRRLTPAEYCGRKGRSLAGSHRDHGLWIAAGPRVRPGAQVDARMADVPATLLQRMQIAPPADSPGRVLWGALHDDDACPQPLPPSTATAAQPRAPRTGRVLQRLQALGYVD